MSQNDLNKEKALVMLVVVKIVRHVYFTLKNILKKLNSLHLIMDNDMIQKLKLQKNCKRTKFKTSYFRHVITISTYSQCTYTT